MKCYEFLVKLRQSKNMSTAKEFYSFLSERGLSCNYSHYMKIEQGKILPSTQIISEIENALDEVDGNNLILVYCKEIFPKKHFLFHSTSSQEIQDSPAAEKKSISGEDKIKDQIHLTTGQKELTPRQVASLAKSQSHYDLFVLLTLARGPISIAEIEKSMKSTDLHKILKEFYESKLARQDGDKICMVHTDLVFPHPQSSPQFPAIYETLDQWDREITARFGFVTENKRMFLRRISPRSLGLIQKHLEVLYDLIKSSDEVDKKYNETVIQFSVQLKSGKMPG